MKVRLDVFTPAPALMKEWQSLAAAISLGLDPKLTLHERAYEDLQRHSSEEERVRLAMVIKAINGWNRIMVGFGGWADPATLPATTPRARR